MLPEISIRSHSSDQFALDKVLYSNSYRLNDFLPGSVVVDVGAHIGSFSIGCSIRGASKIYAFEPVQDNYELLIKNLNNFAKNYRSFQIGVNSESGFFKIKEPELISNAFYETALIGLSETGIDCYFVKLEEIINLVKEKIYLLKVSLPHNREAEFLTSCPNLFLARNLCFETECSKEESEAIETKIKNKGSYNDSRVRKMGEKIHLFTFSQDDCDLCFSKYNVT